jgi:hypothetical protein
VRTTFDHLQLVDICDFSESTAIDMSQVKPIASLSLDLDNQWSYMKTHGDEGWQSFPSYLDLVVPRVLRFLKERDLTITFFLVGQDVSLEKNSVPLKAIADAGHEIGNHSFHHEPWLHLHSETKLESELASAEEHIERVTGRKPIGFRGPGYSLSPIVLEVLARRGYLYDASTLPTFIAPLARAYYFMTARLDREQLQQRRALFGTLRDGLRPIKPYRWRTSTSEIVEIPVTTMPVFKMPIHFSYILYLAGFSRTTALQYFRSALQLCRLSGTAPSLLLHPLDFLGSDDIQALTFFPAMGMNGGMKLELMATLIRVVMDHYTVVTMQEHARLAIQTDKLPVVDARRYAPGATEARDLGRAGSGDGI